MPKVKPRYLSVFTLAMLAAAAVVTSLRGLPMMAKEELTMFWYIGFAALLFLLPAALVAAELGSAFGKSRGGVYTWVGEAFGKRWGFAAIWLQWIQNVVWYPTGLAFAAAALAFTIKRPELASDNTYVGLFCIIAYWGATLVALTGTQSFARLAKRGFLVGTVVPGIALVGLSVYWLASGHSPGWTTARSAAVSTIVDGHVHPLWFPHLTGLSSIAFLAGILLLFAGIESQAVHVNELKDPKHGFSKAMFIAVLFAVGVFTLGALAVAAILPYDKISVQTGVFDAFGAVLTEIGGAGILVPAFSLLICFGALGGALAWITGPSKGLLATARDGELPPFLQKTNGRGIQRNILLVQGAIVTLISMVYFMIDNVQAAFFLISAMTIALYIIMYLLMYAAAIRLRYSQPDLSRAFRLGNGNGVMWAVAGTGFLAAAFALIVSFFPPSQLPVGNPATYVALVAAGALVFTGLPLLIHALRKPSWKPAESSRSPGPPP